MSQMRYISVILPLRLEWVPCYSVPEGIGDVAVGDRVRVSFSNRQYIGVVNGTDVRPDIAPERILPVISVEHELEKIFPQEIELWKAVSDYYLCDIGEVYKAAYPAGKINMEEARAAAESKVHRRRERLLDSLRGKIARIEARLEKKKSNLEKARKDSTKASYMMDIERLTNELSVIRASLEAMESKISDETALPDVTDIDITLSAAQERAFNDIKAAFMSKKPVLLNGVTGSGKTEIYMKLAHEILRAGRDVLYLVPEIALSRQLEDRLYECFGDRLLVYHSGESAAARRNTAEVVRREIPGQARNDVKGIRNDVKGIRNDVDEARSDGKRNPCIVLGTRSAIFLPHHNLGLIIVDEEHDNSYKQDSPAPRYNGRDTALMLSRIHDCDVILGSATPSLEEIYNCQAGRHVLVELKEKYHKGEAPEIEVIDTKSERRKNGMVGNFSRRLIDHVNQTLARGEQVVILRSRRAWATVMQCETCGEIAKCPHCNVSMSLHKDGRMVCHYCGHAESYTGTCGKCGGPLMNLGAGTQRIEEEAASLFPNARIARLDSDTAKNKTFETRTIREFGKGNIDMLIGTQIVTKGFDFRNLTLVAVIAADALLGVQDFRADEKAFHLLEQFRGRSGRRESRGLFVIQTSQPEHPVYQRLSANETASLNMELMQERKEFNFPPYSRIIEIIVRDSIEERAERMIWSLSIDLRRRFDTGGGILNSPVAGPYSPAVDKIEDHHIRVIRLSLKKDRTLAAAKSDLKAIISNFEKSHKYDGHIIINVDPS